MDKCINKILFKLISITKPTIKAKPFATLPVNSKLKFRCSVQCNRKRKTMTSYSKYFKIATETANCADFVHCGDTCMEMLRWNAINYLYGCCKYIGPISAVPILLKFREINVELMKQCFKKFLEYSAAAWLMSVTGLSFMCFYYKLLGKFYMWSILAIPAASGALICTTICSKRLILMFSRGLSTMVTEAIIKLYADHNWFLRMLRDSSSALTLAFMVTNSAIIYALRQIKSDVFWFIHPFKSGNRVSPSEQIPSPVIDRIITVDKHYCQHKNNCDTFLKQEILNYLKIGIGIEFGRILLGNINDILDRPFKFFAFEFVKKLKLNFICFLTGYAGIYRILTCLLTRFFKKDCSEIHVVASFISGVSFYAYPQLSLFGHACATAVELLWTLFLTNQHLKSCQTGRIVTILKEMPWSRIIYPAFFGYLCYLRPFYPWATPKMMMSILRGVTMNRETRIMDAYCSRLLKYSDPNVLYLFGRTEGK